MLIRNERTTDAAVIHGVHAACFPTAAEAQLVDLLRSAGKLEASLVAEIEGAVIGHVAFSQVTVDTGSRGAGLAPVAVVDAYRRRGIAAALIQAGFEQCRSLGCGWAVVLGDPHYYGRFGFSPASEIGLLDEYGGGTAFQAMELAPGELPIGAGLVKYAAEFAAVA